MMTAFSFFSHLGVGFLGFILAVFVTCIVLVKKNGEKYAASQEEVKKEKYSRYVKNNSDKEETDNEDSLVSPLEAEGEALSPKE